MIRPCVPCPQNVSVFWDRYLRVTGGVRTSSRFALRARTSIGDPVNRIITFGGFPLDRLKLIFSCNCVVKSSDGFISVMAGLSVSGVQRLLLLVWMMVDCDTACLLA